MFELIMSAAEHFWTILTTFPVYILAGFWLVECLLKALSRRRR